MKIIVAGCRNYFDYDFVKARLDEYIRNMNLTDVSIVSGAAKGVDTMAIRYAAENNYDCKLFPAEWKRFGIKAGPIRNEQMAKYADLAIIFWDGQSKGTKNMIRAAEKRNLDFIVHMVEIN